MVGVPVVVVPFVGFDPVAVFPKENVGVAPPLEPVVVVEVPKGALKPTPTVPKFVGCVEVEACVVVLAVPKEIFVDVDPVFVFPVPCVKTDGTFDFGNAPLVVKDD